MLWRGTGAGNFGSYDNRRSEVKEVRGQKSSAPLTIKGEEREDESRAPPSVGG
jgi:hypothetical protein